MLRRILDITLHQLHDSYKWNIILEKCGRPDLNVYHLKWKIGTYGNWNKKDMKPFHIDRELECLILF